MDLTGNPPSVNYPSILTLQSNNIADGYKNIQDGQGNNTSARISRSRLEANKIDLVNPVGITSPTQVVTRDPATKELGVTDVTAFTDISYDSGWKAIPAYVPANLYGALNIGNQPFTPRFRCIGKVVYLQGDLWIPNIRTDYSIFDNNKEYRANSASNIFSTVTAGAISTPEKLELRGLVPLTIGGTIENITFPEQSRLRRLYTTNDGEANSYRQVLLRGRVSVEFDVNIIRLHSITGLEQGLDKNYIVALDALNNTHTERIITNKVIATSQTETFSSYSTDFTAGSSNRNVVADDVSINPVSFDMNDARDWAGSFLRLDGMFFTFSKSSDMTLIRNFFDSL